MNNIVKFAKDKQNDFQYEEERKRDKRRDKKFRESRKKNRDSKRQNNED